MYSNEHNSNIKIFQPSSTQQNNVDNTSFSSKRKVLVVAYYFPPMGLSGVQRTLKFVKYLPDFDWQPIVLTTGITSYYAFDDTLLNELENKDVTIYRTDKDPFNPRNKKSNSILKYPSILRQQLGKLILQTFLIPDSRIRWKKYAMTLADKIFSEHPDISIIFATAPPFTDFLIARELSQKYKIPFVVDYRDLWMDSPQYFFPTPFHSYKHSSLEFDVLCNSNKIFVITRTMKEKLLERYKFLSYQDVTVLPHGFDAEDFSATKSTNSTQRSDKLVITHCGLFPDDRTPKYFLKAMSKFLQLVPEARQKIELKFVGIMKKKHIKLIKKYHLNSITTLTNYLPHLEAVAELSSSDVLWMMINNSIETPGRLYEYIGSGKPLLLMLPDGALKQIGKEYKASFITNPKDVKEIVKQLNDIYQLWRYKKLPRPAPKYVNNYNRQYLTSVLAKELSFATAD